MSDIAIVESDAVREGSSIISVASFASMTDALPKMATLSLAQFLAQFEQHTVIADKHSGKLWSPTIYADGANRKSTNVVAITALVVDVDDGTPFAELEAKLAPFHYVVHTSHSHTPAHPKYRVVLPLATPVVSTEWPHVWQRLNLFVDGHADRATKDPARMYFLPSMPSGAEGHFARQNEGRLISIDDLPVLPTSRAPHVPTHGAVDRTQTTGPGNEANFGFFDFPIHTGLLGPDFELLVRRKLISECVPRFGSGISHRLHEVHLELLE